MSLTLAPYCFCGSADWQPAFTLSAPPEGEARFPLPADAYHRDFCQCPRCGHLHGRHEIDLGFLYDGAYVDATYGDYEGIARTFDRIAALPPEKSDNTGRVARIAQSAGNAGFSPPLTRPIHLLDIGAGLGIFPHAIAKLGWEATAVDPDPRAARHMHERLGIEVVQSDIFELADGAIGPFEIVTLNKVLEHVVDPEALLRRAASFLRPDGIVYFEVPDGPGALTQGPHREEFFIEHHHAFSLESARHLARSAGLVPIEAEAIVEPSGKFTVFVFARRR